MSDQFERAFRDLAVLPVVPPTEAGVRRRRRQRQRQRVAGVCAVAAVVAAGTTTAVAYQSDDRATHRQPAAAAGYPASFLAATWDGSTPGPLPTASAGRINSAAHTIPADRVVRIGQFDSTTGALKRYLTGRDTTHPAVVGKRLYFMKGGSGCSTVWQQPLAGGQPRQVPTGRFKGVDILTSKGNRLAWLGCLLPGMQYGAWEGKVLHVQNADGTGGRDVAMDLVKGEFSFLAMALAGDGRIAVVGSYMTGLVPSTITDEHGRTVIDKDAKGHTVYAALQEQRMYVVDPARTDRLSAGRQVIAPAGCSWNAVAWRGPDLVAAVACTAGGPRLVAIDGKTFTVGATIAPLGADGSVNGISVGHHDEILAGGVPRLLGIRVINGTVARITDPTACPDCNAELNPIWLE